MRGTLGFLFIWIVIEVYCDDRIFHTFRCNNGKYINSDLFCNGDSDCDDSSDESFECNDHRNGHYNQDRCDSRTFKCHTGKSCIEKTGRCNTIVDCGDGSDESGCGDETNIANCTVHQGKYLCQDKLKCLDFSYTCDGICNCFDCTDETFHCKQLDNESCSTCPHYCLRSPTGHHCVCNPSDSTTSKLCTKWFDNMIIYSSATKIKMIHIKNIHEDIIQNEVNCTVLTAAKHYLYYVNNRNNIERIFKTQIVSKKTEMIIELDSKVKSLAVDWISSNLYFTTNKSLLVCSNDGRICTRLKCCDIDYVALAPRIGRMFYTQNIDGKDEQVIMKSNMDGSEESALLDKSFFGSISLAVDEWSQTIYWHDMITKEWYFASFDGLKSGTCWISRNSDLEFVTHFSILGRDLFFTKKHNGIIYIAENIQQLDKTEQLVYTDTNNIRQLFTYNSSLQFTQEIDNPCANSSCNGLCLLRSDPLTNGLDYTCMSNNFFLSEVKPRRGDHTFGSALQFKSPAKSEMQVKPSTKSSSTSMKTEPLTPTKASTIYAVFSPAPQTSSRSRESYSTAGIFNVMSCGAFVFSILILCLLIRSNYLAKRRQRFDIVQQIEL